MQKILIGEFKIGKNNSMKAIKVGLTLIILLMSIVVAAAPKKFSGVAGVVDGDTIDVGSIRVRLHGIDTPEKDQVCRDKNNQRWKCGAVATRFLKKWIDGKHVTCIALDKDAYSRIIGVCYINQVDINATLVDRGMAWAFTRFSDDYVAQERRAKSAQLGIWQAENMPAWVWRSQRWEGAVEVAPDNQCPIKGNINRKGERIYHTPWSNSYDKVKINEANGERWFCDEAEAQAAGWRAPFR